MNLGDALMKSGRGSNGEGTFKVRGSKPEGSGKVRGSKPIVRE